MNVLSLFDGMSCGQIALERAGIKVDNYFASEIDKYAIQITQKNYPNTIQIGDVSKVMYKDGVLYTEKGEFKVDIDLVIGGSPCTGFSVAGKALNFEDPQSILFFEYSRILHEVNPKYFLLENVKMKKEHEDVISNFVGTTPVEINSEIFSAQNRKRLYWTNIPLNELPKSKGLVIEDILTTDFSEKTVKDTDRNLRHERTLDQKSLCCTATMYKGAGNNGMSLVRRKNQNELSVLNVNEVEKLQTVPLNYTEGVSNTQRYKMLGNGWTVDVVAFIFKNLKSE